MLLCAIYVGFAHYICFINCTEYICLCVQLRKRCNKLKKKIFKAPVQLMELNLSLFFILIIIYMSE